MKNFKIEQNIFRLAFALILGIFHFQFVVRLLYFNPLDGLPDNFVLISYDSPIYFLWDTLKLHASKGVTNMFFTIAGTLMYVVFGAIVGSVIDRVIREVSGKVSAPGADETGHKQQ